MQVLINAVPGSSFRCVRAKVRAQFLLLYMRRAAHSWTRTRLTLTSQVWPRLSRYEQMQNTQLQTIQWSVLGFCIKLGRPTNQCMQCSSNIKLLSWPQDPFPIMSVILLRNSNATIFSSVSTVLSISLWHTAIRGYDIASSAITSLF